VQQQLTTAHVAQLLLIAVQHSKSAAYRELCLRVLNFRQCPAAQQLSAGLVAQLLDATKQLPFGRGAKLMLPLLMIPAAQELDSSAIISLLTTTIQQEPHDYYRHDSIAHELGEIVNKLCCMPGAQNISVEVAVQLMRAGQQPTHAPCKSALMLHFPAARKMMKTRTAELAVNMW
jgi:hypothetical protein